MRAGACCGMLARRPMALTLSAFVHQFGALGIGLGAGLEGETAVVIGGIVARHGAVSPLAAFTAAWLGSMIADQAFFLLGRWRRDGAWVHKIMARPGFHRAIDFVERNPKTFCIVFRFLYGLRTVGPVTIGLSRIPASLFFALNVLSAAVWAATFTFVGYHFGQAFELALGRALTPLHVIALAAAAIAVALLAKWRHRRREGGQAPES
ncbi:DedA family protein [Novosphingobium sp. ZN18A2]|uniref:DedA family protein n=1 Tax=Novosphingobium sp. ZN18A2 TaxID=3079861 RepID=UPI0030D09389